VREEIHRHARANAFLVAEEEDFFEGRELVGFDGEVDLVDDVAVQERADIGDGMDGVGPTEADE